MLVDGLLHAKSKGCSERPVQADVARGNFLIFNFLIIF